jgi:hypothetical protein
MFIRLPLEIVWQLIIISIVNDDCFQTQPLLKYEAYNDRRR